MQVNDEWGIRFEGSLREQHGEQDGNASQKGHALVCGTDLVLQVDGLEQTTVVRACVTSERVIVLHKENNRRHHEGHDT